MGKLIIFLLLFSSCTAGRIHKQSATVDSTVYIQNENLQRTLHETIENYEKMLQDSSATIIQFDTLTKHDTLTKVVFKDGKVQTVTGPIRYIRTVDTHSETVADSLYTLVQIQHDSIQTLQASKHTEFHSKDKTTRSWWWLWLIIGAVIGWIARPYWPGVKLRIFGIQTKRNYMLLGVFGGGLWVIPLLTLAGFIIFLRQALKASHSGSEQQVPGKGTVYSDENVPIYKVTRFWFAVAFFIATVVIILAMVSDR